MNRRSFITKALAGVAAVPLLGRLTKASRASSLAYTVQPNDGGKVIWLRSSSPVTITLPAGLPTGFHFTVVINNQSMQLFSGSSSSTTV